MVRRKEEVVNEEVVNKKLIDETFKKICESIIAKIKNLPTSYAVSVFISIFNEKKDDFDLEYSKNGIFKNHVGGFSFKDLTKELKEKLRKECYDGEEVPWKNEFSFLRLFYESPPPYLDSTIMIYGGRVSSTSEYKMFDINIINDIGVFETELKNFLSSITSEKEGKKFSLMSKYEEYSIQPQKFTLIREYYTQILPKELGNKENIYVYHIPFFSERGVGGIELAATSTVEKEVIEELEKEFIYGFRKILIGELNKAEIFRTKKLSIRISAVAIMTKNLSHTLASHGLENLARLIVENPKFIYINIYKKKEELAWLSADKKSEVERQKLANFVHYLGTRLDFLADIAFGDEIVWTRKWKFSEIKDYLNPPSINKNDLGTKENTNILRTKNLLFDLLVLEELEEIKTFDIRVDRKGRNKEVAIPNDVTGMQSFCVILENIIRNAIKHRKGSIIKLEIIISPQNTIERNDRKLIPVEITENVSSPDEEEPTTINLALKEPIIDERTQEFKRQFLGIKEMRIAAGYLQKLSPYETEMEIKKNHKNILDIESINPQGLKYTFYMMDPVNIFVISDTTSSNTYKKALEKEGIYFFNTKEEVFSSRLPSPYFLVLPDKLEIIEKDKVRLPLRFINQSLVGGEYCLKDLYAKWLEKEYKIDLNTVKIIVIKRSDTDRKFRYKPIWGKISGDIDSFKEEIQGRQTIILDDHGQCFKYVNELKTEFEQEQCFLFLTGNNCNYTLHNIIPLPESNEMVRYQTIEMALTSILIADDSKRLPEEIKMAASNKYYCKRDEIEWHLNKMNIKVVDSLGKAKKELESKSYQFVLLHQGLIDTENETYKQIKDILTTYSENTHLVRFTARGGVYKLVEDELFIHYSTLRKYLVEQPDKFLLVNVLYSLKR